MMSDESKDYIAGSLQAKDWNSRKIELTASSNETLWARTFDEFLMTRLSLRYLTPIKILQDNGTFRGEGFTIVSVQCALIEFLAALKVGKSHKFLMKGEKVGEHDYTSSNAIFCDFLFKEEPFKKCFPDIFAAREFYKNVRCALLHEARTKNGWKIWASGSIAVDFKEKIVRRDALQIAITSYLDSYGLILTKDHNMQAAFIRKFDNLADI